MFKKVGSTVLGALLMTGGIVFAAEDAKPKTEATPQVGASEPAQPEIPEVVARVGKEEISGAEFQDQVNAIIQSQMQRMRGIPGQAMPQPTPEVYQMAMKSLVDQKLVMMGAAKEKITVEDAEVDKILAQVKQQFGTEDQFNAILKQEGMTLEQLTERIRESEIAKKYLDGKLSEMTKDLDTSDKVLMARYEELKSGGQLNTPETADVAHILVKIDGKDEKLWAEGKAKIDAARKRIVEGKEEFGKVAGEVTDDPGSKQNGGLYANTQRGKMVPEFDKLTFSLPVGEVSEPFKTQFGWHILTVQKRNEAGVMPFEDVKEGIKNETEGMAKQEAFETLLADARKDVKVKILFEDAIAPKDPA